MPFRKGPRDSVPDPAAVPSDAKLVVVRLPYLTYAALERLVKEGFALSVDEAVADATRRYIDWARREIRKRERFRERSHVLDLDGWRVKE